MRIVLRLKTPYSDGTTELLFEPEEIVERLAALVAPPRANLVRYHGMLAPNSRWRKRVVPGGSGHDGAASPESHPAPARLEEKGSRPGCGSPGWNS
ncbi:MAG: transposase [Planctomycetes bacterium]|nr:transposase [Planctomycetota bacterium]